jgi:tripartite-type tricarboxylate transporter receptor subunit TctC
MIVAFAPGGGTDIMLRTMAPFLEAELETQLPVLNRPGASGEIAYTALSQAKPDGYTVSSLNTPGFLTMQIERKLRFDPASICPIARIVEDPGTFIVQTGAEFQSLADLVAYAKENPGRGFGRHHRHGHGRASGDAAAGTGRRDRSDRRALRRRE